MALKHGIVAVLLLGACIAVSAQASADSTARGPPRASTAPPAAGAAAAAAGAAAAGPADPSLPPAAADAAADAGPAPLAPGAAPGAAPGYPAGYVPVFGGPSAPLPKDGPDAPSFRGGLKLTAPDDQTVDGIVVDIGPEARFSNTLFDSRTGAEKKAAGPPAPIPPPVTWNVVDRGLEPNLLTEPPTLPQKTKPAKWTADPKDVKDNSAPPKDAAPKNAAPKNAAPKP